MDIYSPTCNARHSSSSPGHWAAGAVRMRDECGDWRIEGNRGHIYAVPRALDELHAPGFQIYFGGEGVEKGWLNTKREMAFAKVMQGQRHRRLHAHGPAADQGRG